MILKELNLIGFGKFENKVVKLKEGINIIYGENEAGKSTIHSFIDGMFYGFLRPYVKRTIYLEEHDKYNPWSASRYGGVIRFNYEGKNYRIEREFTKNKEDTKVYLEDTGEDITNSIDNGDKGRILQPGFHFFGFNDAIFTNTVLIKQLGSKTESALANEVRDKIVNKSTSLDEDISIEKAISEIDKSLKNIGSMRAPTSPYYMLNNTISKLIEEKIEILADKEEYDLLLEENYTLTKDIEKKELNLKVLRESLKKAEILEKKKIYEEGVSVKKTIEELDSKINDLKPYEKLSMEDYSEGIGLVGNINNFKGKKEELNGELGLIAEKIRELESKDLDNDSSSSTNISQDYMKYEELEEEKNKLSYSNDKTNLEFLKRDLDNIKGSKLKQSSTFIMNTIALLGIYGYSFISKNYFLILSSIPLILFGVFIFNKLNKIKDQLSSIELNINELENKEKAKEERIVEIDKLKLEILDKYNLKSKIELKALFENIQLSIYKKNEEKEKLNENIEKKKSILEKIEQYDLELDRSLKSLERILINNSSKGLEDFKIGLSKKKEYEESIVDRNNREDLLKRILGKFTLKDLENELELFKDEKLHELKTKEELNSEISYLLESISDLKIKQKGIEEKSNILNTKISRLVEIHEETNRKKREIEDLDKRKEALELAKGTIETLSKDIHSQFAPHINKVVGEIIERITSGKYNRVKIDNKLNLGVLDPITKEIIKIDSLSGGTIDQLHFSLRFGIIDSMVKDNLPIILDDCFVQYDNNRLDNILNYLLDMTKGRQILLFTCHNREIDLLKNKDLDFNLIHLT